MEQRDYESIAVEQQGHIVTLTFNRPEKKNPLSQQAINELLWALDDAEADPEVRVLVLTGAGNAFSAGADLKGMSSERGTGRGRSVWPPTATGQLLREAICSWQTRPGPA